MKESFAVLMEIENREALDLIPTNVDGPVWCYDLFINSYQQNLPFMAPTDPDYPRTFALATVIINHEIYIKVETFADCFNQHATYMIDDSKLYVHFRNHANPFSEGSIGIGNFFGITNDIPWVYGAIQYLPFMIDISSLEQKADYLDYNRMAFASFDIIIDNSRGQYDEDYDYFGNTVNLYVGRSRDTIDKFQAFYQGFISNMIVTLETVTFTIKDRRELLNSPLPNSFYSLVNYPYLNPKIDGNLIQDVYGKAFDVVGQCLNEEQYSNDNRIFKFARAIQSIDLLEIEIGKKWTTIDPSSYSIQGGDGTITCSYLIAHDEGDKNKGINAIRATGTFNAPSTVEEIIKDIINTYSTIQYNDYFFSLGEIHNELAGLGTIGLVLDTQKDIFEWIEVLQNSARKGFQCFADFDKFTFRLDNPNRPANRRIYREEILNIDSVRVNFDADNYASAVDIGYEHHYEEDVSRYMLINDYREQILNIHKLDKVIKLESLLAYQADAEYKGKWLMEIYKSLNPIVENIQLLGIDNLGIRLYDIVEIDLSIPGRPQLVTVPPNLVFLKRFMLTDNGYDVRLNMEDRKIIQFRAVNKIAASERPFMGLLRGQIIRKQVDFNEGVTTLDIRQRFLVNL